MSESSKDRLTRDGKVAGIIGIAATVAFVGGSVVLSGSSNNESSSSSMNDNNRRPAPTAPFSTTTSVEQSTAVSEQPTPEPVLTPTPQPSPTETAGASGIKAREWQEKLYVSPRGFKMGLLKGYAKDGQGPDFFVGSNGRQIGVTVSLLSEVDISTPDKEWAVLRKFLRDEGEIGIPQKIGKGFEVLDIQHKELAGRMALEFTSQNTNLSTGDIEYKGYGLVFVHRGSDGLDRMFWFGASTKPKDNIEEFLSEARAIANTFQFTSPEVLPAFAPIAAKIIANRGQ